LGTPCRYSGTASPSTPAGTGALRQNTSSRPCAPQLVAAELDIERLDHDATLARLDVPGHDGRQALPGG
jgi:hypothetical protein